MANYKYNFAGSLSNDLQTITVSDGNKKYQGNETTQFIIFNLPAVKTCPFRSASCGGTDEHGNGGFCYALKAERIYKAVKACRERNYRATLEPEFVPAMVNLITDILNKRKYALAKHVIIRIHESGDFYSSEYFEAWDRIANYFVGDTRVTFIAYTKSIPYIYEGHARNMVISSSIDDSTAPELVQMTAGKDMKVYKAVEAFTDDPAAKKCRCEDCATCMYCMTAKIRLTECQIH